jgi:signal transduction histidine kinase/DNA-binding response OmpR family regulator
VLVLFSGLFTQRATAIQRDSLRVTKLIETAESLPTTSFNTAVTIADSALRIARKSSDAQLVMRALTVLGNIYRENSMNERASGLYKEAVASIAKNDPALADTYLQAGITLLRRTLHDTAMVVLEEGMVLAKRSDNKIMIASLLNVMGNIRREQNQFEPALGYYLESVKLFEELHDNPGLAQALSNVGNLHNLMNQPEKAVAYAEQSLTISRAAGLKSSVAYAHRLIGRIRRKQGNLDEALRSYQEAITLFTALGSRRDVGETHISIGNIYFDQEKLDAASREYANALKIVKQIPDTLLLAYAYSALGQSLVVLNRHSDAARYLDSAITVARKKALTHLEMDGMLALSELYEKDGDYRLSQQYYKNYVALRDTLAERQNKRAAIELEERYQSEKKDNAIRLLDAGNKVKSAQQIVLIVVLLLAVLVALVLYNQYNVKRRANRKLQEMDSLKSRFFTNVSHEFRTPLSLIISPIEKLLEEENDPKRRESFLLIRRNAHQLQTLTEQVLELSRLEAGNLKLHVEEGDLASQIRVIASPFQFLSERKGIVFRCSIDQTLGKACFDRDKISKILNNLLSNAFKFTPEGGNVSLTARAEGISAIIEVKDSGIGIPEGEQEKIFNRFYQVEDTVVRSEAGSGIGLAVAKELVELHRGSVRVSSKSGIGSIFTVTFPFAREAYRDINELTKSQEANEPVAIMAMPATALEEEADVGQDNRPLLMVVEDHEDMSNYLQGLLKADYRIDSSHDGREALRRANEVIPDLILTDWMMPGMDGKAFTNAIRNSETTCHIPVLMLTARADQSSRIEGLETGIDDYLTKPFDHRELLVRINNLLQQRQLLRDAFCKQVILQPRQENVASRDAVFVSKVHALLEERHSDPDLDMDQLSRELAMSRMQLHRKIKALTGQSPGEVLRSFRLEKAKHLLSAEALQVGEVCYKVGFNNLSYFSRSFREYVGMTPSEFASMNSAANK